MGSEENGVALALRFAPSLEQALPAVIGFNFDEVRAEVEAFAKRYAGLVVESDGIVGAKRDRAELNKARTAIEAARKDVKRRCIAPYEAFELRVKELVGLIDEPLAEIDGQLARFEAERVARKRAAIEQAWAAQVGNLGGLLKLSDAWDERWLNASTTMTEVGAAVLALLGRVREDLAALAAACDGDAARAEAAQSRYLTTGRDLAGVLRWMEQDKRTRAALAAQKEIAERNARATAAAAPAARKPCDPQAMCPPAGRSEDGPAPSAAAAPAPAPVPAPVAPAAPVAVSAADDPEMEYSLRFKARRSVLLAMRDWMVAHGVQYVKL